jgi:hypothetical protein
LAEERAAAAAIKGLHSWRRRRESHEGYKTKPKSSIVLH